MLVWPQVTFVLHARAFIHRLIQDGQICDRFAAHGVERAGLDQPLHHALVHFMEIDAATEFEEGPERPGLVADRR